MGQTTFTGPVVSQNGFIENSFTTAQLLALPNPTEGLLVYNTTLNEYQVYNGSSFQPAFGPAAPIPVVNSVNPPSISTTGGAFDIFGSNFTGATAVTLGGTPAASFFVVNDGFIQCNSGSHPAGTVSVNVTTPAGTNGPNNLLTYVAVSVPVITSLSPNNGSTAGGTNVTILGSNFTGTTTVNVGGLPAASFVLINDNQIDAVTPSAAGTGPVNFEVVTGAGASVPGPNSVYTYTAAPALPVISNVDPAGGTVFGGPCNVTITGSNFTGTTNVTVDGSACSYNLINDSTITVTQLPPGPSGAVGVYVTNAAGTGTPYVWQYYQTPRVTGISPSSGSSAGGTSVTVTGYALTNMTECQFYGATETTNMSGISATNDNQATFNTPAHAAEITQLRGFNSTYGYGNYSAPIYTYIAPPPIITSTSRPGGSVFGGASGFDVQGSNFTGATSVTFNGNPSSSFAVTTDSTISINNLPAGTAGPANIVVTTPGGVSNTYTGWSYYETPRITYVDPVSGTSAGGTFLNVYGYALTNMSECQFYGATETTNTNTVSVLWDNLATISSTPAHAAEITQLRGFNSTYGYGPYSDPLYTYTPPAPTFTLGNILVSQGNPVAGAGNIAINQLTGTKMLIGQINNLKSIDFAGSFGPWNPTGTSSTPTTEYTSPFQTGATNNLGFTLNGAFFVSWDYSANQFWGYETVTAPWDWTSGVTVTGPISVPSFAANFGVEAAFTLDYSGNKLYISNLTTLKQYNLPSQYNISNVNNGADDIYDISVDGILSDIKAVQWNNAGTHVYLLVSDGKIWRYTASSAFVVSSLNSPEQVFDANASINTSTYGTPDLNYHSVGMSVKADSEDRILLYMHTSFLNTTENYLIQLTT